MPDFDFIIIGGGAAGFAAATKASELGARTAMINDGLPLGGTCVNVGCVPSKHLLAVGDAYFYARRPRFDALRDGQRVAFDFRAAIAEKRRLVAALREANYADVLASLQSVEFIEGHARFEGPGAVEVNGRTLTAGRFLIATGSRPAVLPFPGIEDVGFITNREAMELDDLPGSMIVVGEREIADELQRCLEAEGMRIHCACEIRRVWQEGGRRHVEADVIGERRVFSADQLLLATGVVPNTEGLGLERAGVRVDGRGFVEVDASMETSAPGSTPRATSPASGFSRQWPRAKE